MIVPPPVLPVAPRPQEGEWLSSWRERVACRYGVGANEFAAYLGMASSAGFASRGLDGDFAPDFQALRVWATACRLDEGVLQALVLSRASLCRAVWITTVGFRSRTVRAAVCLACLDADAEAGDHFIRADWMRVEALACRRDGRLLGDVCDRCLAAGEGWRFRLLGPNARLACVRCDGVVRSVEGVASAEHSGFRAALDDLQAEMRTLFDAMTPLAAEVLETARRLWHKPALRTGARFLGQRPSPSLLARIDVSALLAALPCGWRAATLIAVAQILDLGAARRDFGAPVFGLARLKEWTDQRAPEREPHVCAPAPALAAVRERTRYRAMAEAILASDDWRQGQIEARPSAAACSGGI